jgi:hypothetical protein
MERKLNTAVEAAVLAFGILMQIWMVEIQYTAVEQEAGVVLVVLTLDDMVVSGEP